jgi:uncharacterized protein (TIGR01777 family)
MRLLITGSSGLIGSRLFPLLEQDGHLTHRLIRSSARRSERDIYWNPLERVIEKDSLKGMDGVIHLAGETIVGRWTEAKKRRIRTSRVDATRWLAETLAELPDPPGVFISASATGYYGNRGEERLDEDSPPGEDYLPDVCVAWEQASQNALSAKTRLVHLRLGLVLTPEGGALARMLPAFRLGAGGRLGRGDQFMSWITLVDVLDIIRFALSHETLSGPFNVVAPEPVTNREFTRALGRALRRPTVFPVPAFMIRLLFGEMGEALLLGGARVYPKRLLEAGYVYRNAELEPALRDLLAT